jgi:nucleotide-binding universal stress UspA family protein
MTATPSTHRATDHPDGWQHAGPAWSHVLFATDGTPGSLTAAERALDTAMTDGGVLTILVVRPVDHDPSGDEEVVDRLPRSCRSVLDRAESQGVTASVVVRHGPPGQTIVDVASELEASAIVLSRHGWPQEVARRTATCGYVLSHSDRPVLVIQPWAPSNAEV